MSKKKFVGNILDPAAMLGEISGNAYGNILVKPVMEIILSLRGLLDVKIASFLNYRIGHYTLNVSTFLAKSQRDYPRHTIFLAFNSKSNSANEYLDHIWRRCLPLCDLFREVNDALVAAGYSDCFIDTYKADYHFDNTDALHFLDTPEIREKKQEIHFENAGIQANYIYV